MSFDDDGHACPYTRELANASVDLGIERRQKRAADLRNRRMAFNCIYTVKENGVIRCRADNGAVCERQCGNDGAIVDHEKGVLIHAKRR